MRNDPRYFLGNVMPAGPEPIKNFQGSSGCSRLKKSVIARSSWIQKSIWPNQSRTSWQRSLKFDNSEEFFGNLAAVRPSALVLNLRTKKSFASRSSPVGKPTNHVAWSSSFRLLYRLLYSRSTRRNRRNGQRNQNRSSGRASVNSYRRVGRSFFS